MRAHASGLLGPGRAISWCSVLPGRRFAAGQRRHYRVVTTACGDGRLERRAGRVCCWPGAILCASILFAFTPSLIGPGRKESTFCVDVVRPADSLEIHRSHFLASGRSRLPLRTVRQHLRQAMTILLHAPLTVKHRFCTEDGAACRPENGRTQTAKRPPLRAAIPVFGSNGLSRPPEIVVPLQ